MNETRSSSPTIDPASSGDVPSQVESAGHVGQRGVSAHFIGFLWNGIPTVVVLALLAGLALWGHQNGWSMPGFSELVGTEQNNGVLWCDEHGVAERDCISCNADLMPKSQLYGWCKEHGVHECVLHNPQTTQVRESPGVTQEDFARAARAIAVRPRTKNDPNCKMHLRRIQFPTIESIDRTGVDIGLVDRGLIVETIKVTGEVVYDPTRVAQLSSRAPGTVWRVEKNVGDTVQQGDILAIVDAVEVGQAKSKLLEKLVELELAKKTLQRISGLGGTAIPFRQIEETRSAKAASDVAVANAAQRLSNLGLPIQPADYLDQPIEKVQERLQFLGLPATFSNSLANSSNLIPVFASRDGIVVRRGAVSGEVVEAGQPLFTIVDTSQLWLLLDVRLEEADRISLGQKIVFRPDGSEEETIGAVSWISTEVEAETRTVQVRSELDNANGRLRNETFGSGEIVLREETEAIVVPNDAVHWEGCCHVAFVRDKDYFKEDSYKVFHTRSVRPGAKMDGYTEVIAGLLPGEVVVTKGSGVMRAELLKGNLGAG